MTLKRISLVRRRDGETEPYDADRVIDSVRRALAASGSGAEHLAVEIGGIVSVFLEKTFYEEIPGVDQIEEMVGKVLIETGYDAAARAFILHRDRAARLREAALARGDVADPTLFGPRVILVEDAARERVYAFSHERLARVLAADGLLGRDEAQDVAARVEQRLRRAGVARAPESLVRALAEVEVFDRTLALDLRRRSGVVLQPEDVAESLHRRAPSVQRGLPPAVVPGTPFPRRAADELGAAALRFHALSDLLAADVAQAHLDGDLHVHGLTSPASLFAASLAPSDVFLGRVPGGGTRGVAEAAHSPRRALSALGRGVRALARATDGPVAVSLVALGFAAFALEAGAPAADVHEERRRSEAERDELDDDAFQLLSECSLEHGGAAVELDLTPDVPDRVADRPALDGAGCALEVPCGELADAATRFAAAVLRVAARGTGLPPREALPRCVVTVSERTLATPGASDVLRAAAEAALRGDPVVFVLARGGAAVGGTSGARSPDDVVDPEAAARAVAGRVTLNLPRAAARAGRGNVERFYRMLDRLVDHAMRVHRRRRELLVAVGGRGGGSMAPLLRPRRSRPTLYEPSSLTWSIGITGLNEAVALLTGFELHESHGDAPRVARGIVEYLRLRTLAAGAELDLRVTLDADEDVRVAERFVSSDRRSASAEGLSEPAERYTVGACVRADAPVDVLHRVECEEPLHRLLVTATHRLPVAQVAGGGADGVLALLRSFLRNGEGRQVEIGPW